MCEGQCLNCLHGAKESGYLAENSGHLNSKNFLMEPPSYCRVTNYKNAPKLQSILKFTAEAFTGLLQAHGVQISMDGHGRALDNIFVERLWRSVKYEDIYLRGYGYVPELMVGLTAYFEFYNNRRPH